MRTRALSMLALCLGVAVAVPVQPASGQVQPDTVGVRTMQPGTVGAETIRRMLLGPGAWLMNWPDTATGFLTGNATLSFEMRGNALMVRIQVIAANVGCEREATITPTGVAFDGCRETGIVLRPTPDDPVFAFRGQSGLRWYTLRPH